MGEKYAGKAAGPCVRCRRLMKIKARGLCKSCYFGITREERDRYPAAYNPIGNPKSREIADISEPDLEKMIAEQLACRPAWWKRDEGASEKAIRRFVKWRLPVFNTLRSRGGRVIRKSLAGHH